MSEAQTGNAASQTAGATKQKSCRVHFIGDEPTTEDKLGTLQTITDALASTIEKQQNGGKAILLEGTWGSGKSSVIKTLAQKLKDDSSIAIVIYDAWGHQGDPLRRSFIESILTALGEKEEDKKWLKGDFCQPIWDTLSRRVERTKVKTSTALASGAVGAAIGALLVPIGVVLFSEALKQCPQTLPFRRLDFWIGIILSLAPFWLGLVCYFGDERNKKKGLKRALATIFSQTKDEVIQSSSYKTPDPTSIEFCELFDKVLNEALGSNSERKLVLVVDNLDRLPVADGLALWSTMRSIFEEGSPQRPKWRDRLWLIVPMDTSAAERLWGAGGSSEDKTPSHANEFVAKTFQIRFRVPMPLFTSWNDYLRKKLCEAIPCCKEDKNEMGVVERLFDILSPEVPLRVTPRRVIQFANRVAAIHAQWKSAIPLRTQVAYALKQDELHRNPESLASRSVLPDQAIALLATESWQTDLARIHYGISDSQTAAQVVLDPIVEQALKDNDQEKLAVASTHQWFDVIVDSLVVRRSKSWADNNGAELTNAALALAYLEKQSPKTYRSAWKSLAASAPRKWLRFGAEEGKGLVEIIRHSDDQNKLELAGKLVASFSGHADLNIQPESPEHAARWLEGALAVVRYLTENNLANALDEHLRVPFYAQLFVAVAAKLLREPDCNAIARFFQPYQSPQTVTQYIVEQVKLDKASDELRDAVLVMTLSPDRWQLGSIVTEVRNKTTAARPSPVQADAYISILTSIAHSKSDAASEAKQALDSYRNNQLYSYLQSLRTSGRNEGAARCAFVIFERAGQTGPVTSTSPEYPLLNNPENPQWQPVADSFALLVKSWMPLAEFVGTAQKADAKPLARFVLNHIAAEPDAAAYFNPEATLTSIRNLKAIFDNEATEFIQSLPTFDATVSLAASRQFKPGDSDVYLLLTQSQKPIREDWLDFLERGCGSLSESDWQDELKNPTALTELVSTLAKEGRRLPPDGPLAQALSNAYKKMEQSATNWTKLLNVLPKETAGKILSEAIEHALASETGPKNRVAVLESVKPSLASRPDLANKIVEWYQTRIMTLTKAEVEWLMKALNELPADTSVVEALGRSISDVVNDPNKSFGLPTRKDLQKLNTAIDDWLEKRKSPPKSGS